MAQNNQETLLDISKIEYVNLSDLVPDTANARKHSDRNVEEVARSIREFGQHAPLVVQEGTNRILVGNCRYEAMMSLGWEKAAVYYVNDDNIQAVRRSLADNRTAELAEWDDDTLTSLLNSLGADVDVPGWSNDEIEALLGLGDIPEVIDYSDEVDDRSNRTSPGKSNMIVSIGTLSVTFAYEKTQAIIDAIMDGYSEGEEDAAMERFCEWLYEKRRSIYA